MVLKTFHVTEGLAGMIWEHSVLAHLKRQVECYWWMTYDGLKMAQSLYELLCDSVCVKEGFLLRRILYCPRHSFGQ